MPMDEDHSLSQQLAAAQVDTQAADRLIEAYMPFIRSETAKFLRRPPVEGRDDALSIAMMAFHEAVIGYAPGRGGFLRYAALLIKSRLIDEARRQRRHRDSLSLDAPTASGTTLSDVLPSGENPGEALALREATRDEILELSAQIASFGVSLSDVADNCPRQGRTLEACRRALAHARTHPDLLEELVARKRLPIARLAQGSGVERKTLERHRKYLVALLLIHTNGYEIIRGHLKQVLKGGGAQ